MFIFAYSPFSFFLLLATVLIVLFHFAFAFVFTFSVISNICIVPTNSYVVLFTVHFCCSEKKNIPEIECANNLATQR